MTLIFNTTNIPEDDIRLITSIVKPKDIPEVREIALRNKREGDINGNWGKFYTYDYYITLCVPQAIKNYECIRTVTRKSSFYKNRYDFLAAIIGHEYYHAWQWNKEQDIYHCREYLEVGAERYEEIALGLWVKYKEDNNWVDPPQADDSIEIGAVRYKDYRGRINKC